MDASGAPRYDSQKWQIDTAWGGVMRFPNRASGHATGSWIQEGPIGVSGGVNLYQYNGSNRVSFSDPFGLEPTDTSGQVVTARSDTLTLREKLTRWIETTSACTSRNRFSQLFPQGWARTGVTVLEIAAPTSLAGDILAYQKKLSRGPSLGSNPSDWASGMNWATKRAAIRLGASQRTRGILRATGDFLTRPLAVVGAFTFGYNASIAVQCGTGVLE